MIKFKALWTDLLGEEPEDFETFMSRIGDGSASQDDQEKFYLRLVQHFVDCVANDEVPKKWVCDAVAYSFIKVIAGGSWQDSFPLPWLVRVRIRTRAEERALQIYCDVENRRREHRNEKVTHIIKQAATQHNVSYESARDSYYNLKRKLSKNIAADSE